MTTVQNTAIALTMETIKEWRDDLCYVVVFKRYDEPKAVYTATIVADYPAGSGFEGGVRTRTFGNMTLQETWDLNYEMKQAGLYSSEWTRLSDSSTGVKLQEYIVGNSLPIEWHRADEAEIASRTSVWGSYWPGGIRGPKIMALRDRMIARAKQERLEDGDTSQEPRCELDMLDGSVCGNLLEDGVCNGRTHADDVYTAETEAYVEDQLRARTAYLWVMRDLIDNYNSSGLSMDFSEELVHQAFRNALLVVEQVGQYVLSEQDSTDLTNGYYPTGKVDDVDDALGLL